MPHDDDTPITESSENSGQLTEWERDFVREAKRRSLESLKSPNHTKWRKESIESFDFTAGGAFDDTGQWEADDIKEMKKHGRPVLTLNRVEPLVEGIVGAEVNNRQEATYIPRETGDKGVAHALNEVAKWAREGDVEEEESDAFRNAIICGMGWLVSTMEYDQDPDGKFTVVSTDPLGHLWDIDARRPNLTDARWLGYREEMTREKFKAMFPGKKGASNIFGESMSLTDDDTRAEQKNSDYDDPALQKSGETVTVPEKPQVLEYQCYKLEPSFRVLVPGKELSPPMGKKDFDAARKQAELVGMVVIKFGTPTDVDEDVTPVIRFIQQERRVYYRAFFSGDELIDEIQRNPWRNGFTMQPITGRRHRGRNIWYGVVRAMKDAQRMTNKFMSAAIHHYNSNPKGGMFHEEGAVNNPDDLAKNIAAPSPLVELNPGGLAKIQMINPAAPSAALDRLMQIVADLPPMITGISMEFIGLAGRDQAVGLEQTRKLATLSIVSPMFSSFRKYRKTSVRLLFDYMKDYFTVPTMTRVVSEISRPHVPQIKNSDTIKYDIHVDDAPLSPSIKSTVFSIFKDMLQFLPPELAQVYLPIFMEYSPLPQGLVQKMTSAFAESQKPDPMAEIGKLLEMRKLEAEGHSEKAGAEFTEAKTDTEHEKINVARESNAIKAIDSALNFFITKMQNQDAGSQS